MYALLVSQALAAAQDLQLSWTSSQMPGSDAAAGSFGLSVEMASQQQKKLKSVSKR
jgi:hypothetical protein